jgi:hypothetical protein
VDAGAFLEAELNDPANHGLEVQVRTLPARDPALEPLPDSLPDLLRQRLELQGIKGLYPHQRAGYDALAAGSNVIVSTGTASGKTLGYKERKDGVTVPLLQRPDQKPWDPFTCLNSLREVEQQVGLILIDDGLSPSTASPPSALPPDSTP